MTKKNPMTALRVYMLIRLGGLLAMSPLWHGREQFCLLADAAAHALLDSQTPLSHTQDLTAPIKTLQSNVTSYIVAESSL